MKKRLLMLVLLGILSATALAQAKFLKTKIPFEFVAGGKTYPAGLYEFSWSNQLVVMKSLETNRAASLTAITRISADNTTEGQARISFDVQEGKHFIEAVWPSTGDGYLLHVVKGAHTHEIVRSK